jgi:hypothetical protein
MRKIAPDVKFGKIGKERILNALSWEHSKKHLYVAYKGVFESMGKDNNKAQTKA